MTDTNCLECGRHLIYLGEGTWVCSVLFAYGNELAKRGDKRTITHDMMREDGERWVKEHVKATQSNKQNVSCGYEVKEIR